MNKKKHTINIARCFLELRNDDTMTDKDRRHVLDSIEYLVIAMYTNLDDSDTKEAFKNELLKIIEWVKIDV